MSENVARCCSDLPWLSPVAHDTSSSSVRARHSDPRWGRGQETYGEDPTLTSAITGAVVAALQNGDDPNYNKMIATSKHWLAYHLYVAIGLDKETCYRDPTTSQAYVRFDLLVSVCMFVLFVAPCRDSWDNDLQYRLSHSFNLSETDIMQYYVKPFAAAVASNVSAIMCAYDGTNVSSPNPLWPNPTGPEPWGVPQYVLTAAARSSLHACTPPPPLPPVPREWHLCAHSFLQMSASQLAAAAA